MNIELSYLKDCIRPESDCILIAKPDAVSGLQPVITHNRYVLTEERVPFDRFVGTWSFVDRAWLDVPEPDELAKMMDYGGDIDIVMHMCHHQLYWDKKNQNEQDGIAWSRHEYVDYVTEEIQKLPVVQKFLSGFQDRTIAPSRPTRSGATPNDQDLGPPEDEDDRKVTALRTKLTARFKRHLEKAQKAEDTSASETDAPKKIEPKKMPRERKNAASAASSEKAPDASDSDAGKYEEDGPRGSVRKCIIAVRHPHRLSVYSAMRMQPPNFMMILRNKLMRSNGLLGPRALSVAKISLTVKPMMPCFGVIHAVLHTA